MRKFAVRLSTVMSLIFALLAGGSLFWVSQQVQMLEHRQRQLKQDINSQKEGIRVLNAEWDYLNRPDRLELLVVEHLKTMTPVVPENLLQDVKNVPEPTLVGEDERTILISDETNTIKKSEQKSKKNNIVVPDARPINIKPHEATKSFDQVIGEVTEGGR